MLSPQPLSAGFIPLLDSSLRIRRVIKGMVRAGDLCIIQISHGLPTNAIWGEAPRLFYFFEQALFCYYSTEKWLYTGIVIWFSSLYSISVTLPKKRLTNQSCWHCTGFSCWVWTSGTLELKEGKRTSLVRTDRAGNSIYRKVFVNGWKSRSDKGKGERSGSQLLCA